MTWRSIKDDPPPPAPDHFTGDGRFYCSRCDTVDCEWLGTCPHTPKLWLAIKGRKDEDF